MSDLSGNNIYLIVVFLFLLAALNILIAILPPLYAEPSLRERITFFAVGLASVACAVYLLKKKN